MELHLLKNRKMGGYVSFGSCWNKGEVKTADFAVKDEEGRYVPVQNETAARWPDGSVKWARHTADSEKLGANITVQPGVMENGDRQVKVVHENGGYQVDAGRVSLFVPDAGTSSLAEHVCLDGRLRLAAVRPVFELERRREEGVHCITDILHCESKVEHVAIELAGPVVCVVKYQGVYCRETNQMPFTIRMLVGLDSGELRFQNTFFYDGDEERDFLKGLGLRFDAVFAGRPWNRHVKLGTDKGILHETAMYLYSYRPRTPASLRRSQMEGEMLSYPPDSETGKIIEEASAQLPVWNRYMLTQLANNAYQAAKQTKEGCCLLDIRAGCRATGTMAVAGEDGGILVGIKDFWQKFPSGLEVRELAGGCSPCYAWFYSPQANAMDYRHYDTRSYPYSNYEGYSEYGACANGIAVTDECFVKLTNGLPDDREFSEFTGRTEKPAVYVAEPAVYHEKRAFGYWSLPVRGTQEEKLERLLGQAVEFYQAEVERRGWYGIYNYGDFMHSYDEIRHCWKYDFGGCAWQNTELVPTYWLWLYFMRTGREEVYTLAEAMSRHCSETDVYHLGEKKGIGSRHNVRHWGCSCKEPRVSMAGHHRPMYYLIGDRRLGDYFDEVLCAPESLKRISHFYGAEPLKNRLLIRTGPDWAAFVSDWMTAYERTLDEACRQKIINGIAGIKAAPLQLASGPSFCFDPDTGDMEYCREFTENIHLTICMGGPQVWLEAAEAVDCEELYQLAADYGRHYLMTEEERHTATGGLSDGKRYVMEYVAAGLGAFCAARDKDKALAHRAWETLMDANPCHYNREGFVEEIYAVTESGEALCDIPWIATNYASQWCLNVMMALEFIRDSIPPEEEWEYRAALPHEIPK